jgi:hypothetical protein
MLQDGAIAHRFLEACGIFFSRSGWRHRPPLRSIYNGGWWRHPLLKMIFRSGWWCDPLLKMIFQGKLECYNVVLFLLDWVTNSPALENHFCSSVRGILVHRRSPTVRFNRIG